ncbi:hypothetical protein Tco_0515476 [Tanacetum coccineum]
MLCHVILSFPLFKSSNSHASLPPSPSSSSSPSSSMSCSNHHSNFSKKTKNIDKTRRSAGEVEEGTRGGPCTGEEKEAGENRTGGRKETEWESWRDSGTVEKGRSGAEGGGSRMRTTCPPERVEPGGVDEEIEEGGGSDWGGEEREAETFVSYGGEQRVGWVRWRIVGGERWEGAVGLEEREFDEGNFNFLERRIKEERSWWSGIFKEWGRERQKHNDMHSEISHTSYIVFGGCIYSG